MEKKRKGRRAKWDGFDRRVRETGDDIEGEETGESVYTILDKTGRSSSYRYPRFMDHRGIQWRVRRVLGVPRSKEESFTGCRLDGKLIGRYGCSVSCAGINAMELVCKEESFRGSLFRRIIYV